MGAVGESREFLFAECARQRIDPGPGLIGQIIREHGDEIDDFDLGGLADGAFTGGLETSASMLALGTVVLLGRPDLYAGLVTDPDVGHPGRRGAAAPASRSSRSRSRGSPRPTSWWPGARSRRARA